MEKSEGSPDIDELLEDTAWLRSLAIGMTPDTDIAEDVVQDTLVAALGASAPRVYSRAWLRRVATNALAMIRRSHSRRRRREKAAARDEPSLSESDSVEISETKRIVAACVLELPDVSRDTILLVYYLSRTPAEVASLQGVTTRTVRRRLARAHDQLREKLRRTFDGEERLLIALFALGKNPQIQGASRLLTGTREASTLSERTRLVYVFGACVVVLVLGLWSISRGGTALSRMDTATVKESKGHPQEFDGTGRHEFGRIQTQREHPLGVKQPPGRVQFTTPRPPKRCTLNVIDHETGVPISGAQVHVSSASSLRHRYEPGELERSAKREPRMTVVGATDEHGQLDMPFRDFRWKAVWVKAQGYSTYWEPKRFRELGDAYSVRLRPATLTTLWFVDEFDKSIRQLEFRVTASTGEIVELKTDIDGRAQLVWEAPQYTVLVDHDHYHRYQNLLVGPEDKIRLYRGQRASGVVCDTEGNPISRATVTLKLRTCLDPVVAVTGPDGTFSTPTLRPERVELHATHPSFSPSTYEFDPSGDDALQIVLEAPKANGILGTLRAPAGGIVRGARIDLIRGTTISSDSVSTSIDEWGRFRFDETSARDYLAVALSDDWGLLATPFRKSNVDRPHELELQFQEPIRVLGRVIDTRGRPLPGILVRLGETIRPNVFFQGAYTDDLGRFQFPARVSSGRAQGPVHDVAKKRAPSDLIKAVDRCADTGERLLYFGDYFEIVAPSPQQEGQNFLVIPPSSQQLDVTLDPLRSHRLTWLAVTQDGRTIRERCVFSGLSGQGKRFAVRIVRTRVPNLQMLAETPQSYTYSLLVRGYELTTFRVTESVDVPLSLVRETEKSFRILGADGMPAANRIVLMRPTTEVSGTALIALGRTNDDGIVPTACEPGTYDLYLVASQVRLLPGEIAPPDLGAEIVAREVRVSRDGGPTEVILEPSGSPIE